jgi:hypothetical protein
MAPLLKHYADRVIWLTQQGLAAIARKVDGVDDAIDEKAFLASMPKFDAHIMSMSLYRVLGITVDTLPRQPYILRPEPFDYGPGFHVGISWRGSKVYANDLFRSTRLEDWSDLLDTPGVTFHSFQVTENEEQLAFADKLVIHEPPSGWEETQRRLAGLNLYISVDSGPVHLAGAMGVESWVLLPKSCDFRWMADGSGSHWYPTLRLYRARENFQWRTLLAEVKDDLCQTLNTTSQPNR